MKLVSTTVLGMTLLVAQSANAQTQECDPNEVAVSGPRGETVTTKYTPHPGLLATGSLLFLGGYIPSMIVAAESRREADEKLWIPVVGPWIDLADRGGCPAVGSCSRESWNKALLIGDGIIQGAGAIAILASLFVPMTTKTYRTTGKPTVRVLPMQMGTGASLGAGMAGTF
jgi:hypothetical protein